MTLLLWAAAVVGLLLAAAYVRLFRRLAAPRRAPALTAAWLESLAAGRYAPLERLLEEEDYRFLAATDRGLARRLRARRRHLIRGYLCCLHRDFDEVYAVLEWILSCAPQDRPDLAAALVRQKAVFTASLLTIRIRLVLPAVGWSRVRVSGVVSAFDALRGELHTLAPSLLKASV